MKKFFKFGLSFALVFSLSTTLLAEWKGDDYAKTGLLQYKWAKNFFFDRYDLLGDEKVLDIGCGDGRLTDLLAQQITTGKVVGFDSSPSMIHHARQHYDSEHLNFVVQDASKAETYHNYADFDLVVSFHCLHWVDNQLEALRGIKKSLKPHGKAFLRLTSNGWDPIQEMADELIQSSTWANHFETFVDPIHRFSQEEYQILVEKAGLTALRLEEVLEDDVFASIDDVAKQVKSWLPHVKHLPEELRQKFLADLMTKYMERMPPEYDGTIHLHDCYLEVELENI